MRARRKAHATIKSDTESDTYPIYVLRGGHVQNRTERAAVIRRTKRNNAHVTAAVGREESYGRRRLKQSSLYTRTLLSLTGLICAALLLATLSQAWSNSNLMQQVQKQQQSLQQVQKTNKQLVKDAQRYNDPATIESEARQQLGYIRPGEHPLIIVDANNKGQSKVQTATTRSAQTGYWQQWWNIFFGASQ